MPKPSIKHNIVEPHLLEHLSNGVVLLNDTLCLEYMNPAAEVLLQTSDNRARGKHVSELFINAKDELANWQRALSHSQALIKREVEAQLKTRQTITLDYSATPIVNALEQPQLLLELFASERMLHINREAQMIKKQALSRQLVRGLAHEVKNPLGGIRGAAQLLEGELKEHSRQHVGSDLSEYTRIIIDEADRLRDLVDKLLGPNNEPAREQVNIHEILERSCQLLNAEFAGNISIKKNYDPSIPDIPNADKGQLMQAVLNLFRNASQAMIESDMDIGKPTLSLKTYIVRQFTIGKHRHRLVLCVEIMDNGCGIPEHLKSQLFYPMITGRADGTGLGLSISQDIVGQLNGIIKFTSEPGCTVFSIYLPLDNV